MTITNYLPRALFERCLESQCSTGNTAKSNSGDLPRESTDLDLLAKAGDDG